MRWDAFEAACPRIARIAEERLGADQLVLVGTIRPDGSPRISPCEVDFADGRLLLGMMWQSRKARDLLRDPRIAVNSVPNGKDNPGGDLKLYGRAVDEHDAAVRTAFREAILTRIDWAPDEPKYHLFSLDVRGAGYVRFGDQPVAVAWDEDRGLREVRHPDAAG